MTIRELASRSGVASVAGIEIGWTHDPGVGTLRAIADALGVSIDELTLSPREYSALLRRRAKVGK